MIIRISVMRFSFGKIMESHKTCLSTRAAAGKATVLLDFDKTGLLLFFEEKECDFTGGFMDISCLLRENRGLLVLCPVLF